MKPRKKITLVMLLGLLLIAFSVAIAQTPAQGDQKKKTENAEESCCKADSCHLKEDGAAAADTAAAKSSEAKHDCCDGDSCKMKKEGGNDADHKECCTGMKMKHDATMKHDSTMKHDAKGHKDCCNIKNKDAKTKTKKAA